MRDNAKKDIKVCIQEPEYDTAIYANPDNVYALVNGTVYPLSYCYYSATFNANRKTMLRKLKRCSSQDKTKRERERGGVEDVYYSDDLLKTASKINNLKIQPINGFYPNNDLKRVKLKDTTKHFTSVITAHGDTYRSFSLANGNKNNFIKKHFDGISDKSFQQLDSLFIKSGACCGGYYDEDTSIFDEIQTKLKKCKGEAPKCFVRLVKKDYVLSKCHMYNEEEQKWEIKCIPLSNKKDKPVIYEELYTNKDKYFDYYYVTKDAIYKVPHELVKNRIELIDNGKFDDEFQKTQNIDINTDEKDVDKVITRKIDPKVECNEYKKLCDEKRLKGLREAAPAWLKDFY